MEIQDGRPRISREAKADPAPLMGVSPTICTVIDLMSSSLLVTKMKDSPSLSSDPLNHTSLFSLPRHPFTSERIQGARHRSCPSAVGSNQRHDFKLQDCDAVNIIYHFHFILFWVPRFRFHLKVQRHPPPPPRWGLSGGGV